MAEYKIALVHDWMVSSGGAERLLYSLHQLWPDAPIYVGAYNPTKFPEFSKADVRPTWLNGIKLARTKHQLFTIPRAFAFKTLDLSEFDIVISSCSAESKYIKKGPNTLHICYCHTPIRYYWSDYDWYRNNPPFGKLNWLASAILPIMIPMLRRMDYKAAQKVDLYIANSENVKARIKKYYDRDSTVIFPPIQTKKFGSVKREVGDYYVIAGRQVAYKRLDLAIDAFNQLGYTLKVAGEGEEQERQKLRSKKNIEYLGRVSDEELLRLFAGAKGFIFPPEEDFGMIPPEAMAAGCPVIAYGKGGALETVVEGVTGTFFAKQTKASLIDAIRRFEKMSFSDKAIRAQAAKFDEKIFKDQISEFVDVAWNGFGRKRQK